MHRIGVSANPRIAAREMKLGIQVAHPGDREWIAGLRRKEWF
jgi:hypothetical protein